MWEVVETETEVHTMPVNDIRIHYTSESCPCSPYKEPGGKRMAYMHHAFDAREFYETPHKT